MAMHSPWYIPLAGQNHKLRISELALYAVLGAVTFGAKFAMMALPNIEPVSLLVMLYAVTFGRKALYPIYVYAAMEILIYGFSLWNINYLYIWLILAGVSWLLRDMQSALGWAIVSGAFGLLFGALCAPVYVVTGGLEFAMSWWIAGIPYDLLHCAANFVIALVLFKPLRKVLGQQYARLRSRA